MKRAALFKPSTVIAVCCLLAAQARAADHLQLHWNDLGALVSGRSVRLPLKDGARIEGLVRGVGPGAMDVSVTRTSDRRIYPKGLISVARNLIGEVELLKPGGHKGAIIGGIVGAVSAAGAAGGALEGNASEGQMAVAVAAPLVMCTGVGWLIDHAARPAGTRITITPD